MTGRDKQGIAGKCLGIWRGCVLLGLTYAQFFGTLF